MKSPPGFAWRRIIIAVWVLALIPAVVAELLLFSSLPEVRDGYRLTGHVLIPLGMLGAGLALLIVYWRRMAALRQEELAEMSQRLDLAMEASQIGFWNADVDADQLKWDARACQLMGVEPREGYFTEADWLNAVHPEDRHRTDAAAVSAIREKGRFTSDYRVVWSDGEVRHLRDMAAFYRSGDGAPRLAGLVWDVTADKKREAEIELRRREAEAANIAKSNFLAVMSHEIRTPLAGIIGMLDLMLTDERQDRQMERARIASASARNLLRLLNDVLAFSKLEAGSVVLSPSPVDLRALVGEVTELMSASAEKKALTLTALVDEAVPRWMSVDALRLRQVLTNVISNAIAYTPEGHVTIRVSHCADSGSAAEICFAVEDSGMGISEADCQRIFDRFAQADSSSSRRSEGTGLGLAIARELVELMGGSIGVESAIGQGSTFRFNVRAAPCPIPAEANMAPARNEARGAALDVLVAEDNPTNQYLIRTLLDRAGHRSTIVRNGGEAVEAARAGQHDVILMDIQMPDMDGVAASQAIRTLTGPENAVPIIALTASAFAEDRARYVEAGMTDCLAKPIDFEALARVLGAIVPRTHRPCTAQT